MMESIGTVLFDSLALALKKESKRTVPVDSK